MAQTCGSLEGGERGGEGGRGGERGGERGEGREGGREGGEKRGGRVCRYSVRTCTNLLRWQSVHELPMSSGIVYSYSPKREWSCHLSS